MDTQMLARLGIQLTPKRGQTETAIAEALVTSVATALPVYYVTHSHTHAVYCLKLAKHIAPDACVRRQCLTAELSIGLRLSWPFSVHFMGIDSFMRSIYWVKFGYHLFIDHHTEDVCSVDDYVKLRNLQNQTMKQR